MLNSNVLDKVIIGDSRWKAFSLTLLLPVVTLAIAFLIGISLGIFSFYLLAAVVGTLVIVLLISLRKYELIAAIVVVEHLYVDWYIGLLFSAQVITLVLLILFFLFRSSHYPWEKPHALWLWMLFLIISIVPAIKGAVRLYDIAYYYPNIICGALLMFWLGTIIARDSVCVKRLFQILSGVGTLLAIHTIIQSITGTTLFGSTRFDQFLATTSDYALIAGSTAFRVGSFFVDPNWNGTFFATMLFLPLGLFFASSSFLGRLLYLAEALIVFPALLFTYSNGAWIGVFGGIVTLIIFIGRPRYRILLILLIGIIAIVVLVYFPSQFSLQLQHASNPAELSLRLGAWHTGIQVISAFPLNGVGLGLDAYLVRAEPYRVPAQLIPLSHPHNSYIEIGAMAGLPVLIIFVALVLFALWLAFRNWRLADAQTRSLVGAGLTAVIVLSINSLSINAWTFPPLAAVGWIILGAISSPLLTKSYRKNLIQERETIITRNY